MILSLQQLRERSLELKVEKADLMAEISQVNETLAQHLKPDELRDARVKKFELSADMADIDVDLAKVNAAIEKVLHAERDREQRLHNIRLLTAALLKSGQPHNTCVQDAVRIEKSIQALEPMPQIDLPIDDADEAA